MIEPVEVVGVVEDWTARKWKRKLGSGGELWMVL